MRVTMTGVVLTLCVAGYAGAVPATATVRAAPRSAATAASEPLGASVAVGVTLPPVVFGLTDHLPATVRRGTSYVGRYAVHVHPTAGPARATVDGCAAVDVPLGVVTTLTCPVQPRGARITATVRVTTGTGVTYAHTYRHAVSP